MDIINNVSQYIVDICTRHYFGHIDINDDNQYQQQLYLTANDIIYISSPNDIVTTTTLSAHAKIQISLSNNQIHINIYHLELTFYNPNPNDTVTEDSADKGFDIVLNYYNCVNEIINQFQQICEDNNIYFDKQQQPTITALTISTQINSVL